MPTSQLIKFLLLPLLYLFLTGVSAENSTTPLAPGYGQLPFIAAAPGSYHLPALGSAANGQILTSENIDSQLHTLMGDKIVLLSFIYSTCNDINGCPLATAVFHKIKKRLNKEPQLAKQLRLLTLSFNPQHDTPEAMKHYAEGFQNTAVDWQFLTTYSEQQLQPILQQYRQSIQKVYDPDGNFTGTFSHILRVYLIDKKRQIRNIYSVSFLHPDTLINDVKTLLSTTNKPTSIAKNNTRQAIGFKKSSPSYTLALTDRVGKKANLIKTINHPPLGLPSVPVPSSNPITPAKISLGRKLFFDRRLSINNTFSCAMCHIPEQGFSSNEMATAVGFEGRTVRRNSPTLYNVAYSQSLFHDGRETTLENQAWGPLLATNEMANPSIGYVIEKIKHLADYKNLFEAAFKRPVGMETIGQALASYQRTLNSANSAFDRWYYDKQTQAINNSAQRGYQLFTGKAQCSTCHTQTAKHALLTDNQFHNTGIGYQNTMGSESSKRKIQLIEGLIVNIDTEIINQVSEAKPRDLGRYEVTQNPADRWKYKTPSLRNINLSAPYMHDGSLATLEQVVHFYNQGGVANPTLDPLIKPLHLTAEESKDLVSFLQTLTGDNVEELIKDAFSQAIGDTTMSK